MPVIREPVRGSQSFAEASTAAELSQAAVLLLMGHRLRGTHLVTQSAPVGRATMWQSVKAQLDDFPVPELPPRRTRVPTAQTLMQLNRVQPRQFPKKKTARPVSRAVLKQLADRVYQANSHDAAAQLFEACL